MSPSPIEARYIGRRELLKQLGVSKHTLIRWSKQRDFPAPLPGSGNVPIYDAHAVDAWMRAGAPARETRTSGADDVGTREYSRKDQPNA